MGRPNKCWPIAKIQRQRAKNGREGVESEGIWMQFVGRRGKRTPQMQCGSAEGLGDAICADVAQAVVGGGDATKGTGFDDGQ